MPHIFGKFYGGLILFFLFSLVYLLSATPLCIAAFCHFSLIDYTDGIALAGEWQSTQLAVVEQFSISIFAAVLFAFAAALVLSFTQRNIRAIFAFAEAEKSAATVFANDPVRAAISRGKIKIQ